MARTVATGSPSPESMASKPIARALASRTGLRSSRITRPAPRTSAASPPSRPIAPAPVMATVSPGVMLPRLATWRAMDAGSMTAPWANDRPVGQREDALDAVDRVRGVDALDAVAVLLVEAGLAVVLAQVVAALDALLADAAGVVRGAGHAVADLPAEALGARAQGGDLARPLVPRDERERGRPEARVVAPDEVGVGAADGDRADPGEDLVGSGHRDRDLPDLEHRGLEDDEGLHGRGQGGHRV